MFNLSFITGVFSSILKNCKNVVPVSKKDSKLGYSIFCRVPLLSNIETILEKQTWKKHSGCENFSVTKTFMRNNNL